MKANLFVYKQRKNRQNGDKAVPRKKILALE